MGQKLEHNATLHTGKLDKCVRLLGVYESTVGIFIDPCKHQNRSTGKSNEKLDNGGHYRPVNSMENNHEFKQRPVPNNNLVNQH